MKILVTGASGFIGSNFVFKQLNETNNQVINFDNLTYAGDISKFDSIKNNNNYKFIKGDICDRETVANIFSEFQPDAIINFAAESHVDRSLLNMEIHPEQWSY